MTPSRKRLILFGLLTASIGASIWVTDMPEIATPEAASSAVPNKRNNANSPSAKTNKDNALELEAIQRASMSVGEINPFNSKSWYVAPPPPPPPPPQQPSAPPLPFAYAGKLEEEGKWVVYLTRGDQFFAVSKGDTFDQNYRLEGVENGNLVIQYLPMSIKQVLAIGADS